MSRFGAVGSGFNIPKSYNNVRFARQNVRQSNCPEKAFFVK